MDTATVPWESTTRLSLDYVIASVYGVEAQDLIGDLEALTGLRVEGVAPLKSYKGYTAAAGLFFGGDRAITIQWAHERAPLVIAPGFISGQVAAHLQSKYEHQCSRKDAAVDFLDDLAFDPIAKCAIKMANDRVLKSSLEGDWATPGAPNGRTLYVMSRRSTSFLRIYEHSKLHGGDVECRVEVEIKPDKKPGKLQLAACDVAGVIGLCTFAVDLLRNFSVDVAHVPLANYSRQLSELDQKLVRLFQQYGKTIKELLEREGGDISEMGLALLRARERLDDRINRANIAAARPKAVPLISL